MFNPLLKILGVIALVFTTAVNAEEKDPFDITIYGSFLHTSTVPNALFFFNDIEQYDSFELRRAIRNHKINIVVLASDGGSVWEGLNMAGIIHDKGIATYVPKLTGELGCYSACSFMFFGGKIRKADGILAVHQAGAYGSERDKAQAKVSETQQNTQFTVSEIIGFLNEFETPPWVFEKMFRSRKFYFFDEDEKERLAARTEEISAENLREINTFVSSFLKYLDDTSKRKEKVEEETETTEEEQLRLAVIEIQKLLNEAGCNAGIADGIWGRRTQAAAVLFAKTAQLPFSQSDLLSKTFIQRLRLAQPNFCPKQVAKRSKSKLGDYYIKPSYKIECAAANSSLYGTVIGTVQSINVQGNAERGSFVIQFKNQSGKKIQFRIEGRAIVIKFNNGNERFFFTEHIGATISSFPFSGFNYNGCTNFRAR